MGKKSKLVVRKLYVVLLNSEKGDIGVKGNILKAYFQHEIAEKCIEQQESWS